MTTTKIKFARLNGSASKPVALVNPTDSQVKEAIETVITKANGLRRQRLLTTDYCMSEFKDCSICQTSGGSVARAYKQQAYTTPNRVVTIENDRGTLVILQSDESSSCKGSVTPIWSAREYSEAEFAFALLFEIHPCPCHLKMDTICDLFVMADWYEENGHGDFATKVRIVAEEFKKN